VTVSYLQRPVDAVAMNYGQGWPERGVATATWRGFQNRFDGDLSRVILGYHGYRHYVDSFLARQSIGDFERRPWAHGGWPDGLRALMTEAGLDTGAAGYANGYRTAWTSAEYAAYLKGLPQLVPEAMGFCVYLCGTVDPDKWRSFDILGDAVVLDAIAETNGRRTPMPTKNLGTLTLSDAESAPFDAWIAAAGGAAKVVLDSFRLWYAATQGDVKPTRADLITALAKIGSGSNEAMLIANKLPLA